MVLLVVVDGNENHAVIGEQLLKQLQARPHHAEPLVVAFQVFVVNRLMEPLFHQRAVHSIVVGPALVAGVVGRVDVDAFDAAGVAGQQGFECLEVIAVDDEVVVCFGGVQRLGGVGDQRAIGDGQVVGVDNLLAFELQGGHGSPHRWVG